MSFFDSILLNMICILFPLALYLIYLAYRNNINSKNKYESVLFEFLLLTSIILTIKLTGNKANIYGMILINIPILFSYLRGKKIFSIFLSIIIVNYYVVSLGYDLWFTVFEYACYYVLYKICNKKNITAKYIVNTFTLFKSFFLSFFIFYYINPTNIGISNFIYILLSLIVFHICSNLYYALLSKGEEIINLNNTLKELEREKTLRKSLFKLTHEIKNPLAVCKGYLDMLDIDNKENTDKYLSIIKSEVERTLVLMDDFLDYSKIKVNRNIMDVNYLLEDTINSMESLFNANNVHTRIKISEEELFIDGDYNRLKQVLVNVLKNSIESKKEYSNLKINILVERENDNVKIIIKDNGIGMDKEELEMLGEAFYTTKHKGTGLGISLSKEIIELHQGMIIYTSEKNKGTSVTVLLPIYNF